jgi:twitching motility protein PilT
MATAHQTLFSKAAEAGASDVHIAVGIPILFRIDGILTPQTKTIVGASEVEKIVKGMIGEDGYKRLKEYKEIDISHQLEDGTRLRVNCHFERGNLGMVARIVPAQIPSIEELGLQEIADTFCVQREGLVLFTGPTGEGKSTSLAALIQQINASRPASIVTLEDPIEFLFPEGMGVVRQREMGQDFLSFPEALKRVLRQDPEIVMVGEMRDPETIAAALTLAETGHLIFATLHTPNTWQTIDRIIDVFPPHQQPQIRSQLSLSLKAVIAQRLLPKEGGGRIAQREVMVNTPAVGNIIREGRLQELKSVLQTGGDEGMKSFEKDAKRLYKEGLISKETYEWAGE